LPKQFVKLFKSNDTKLSLFQKTLQRNSNLCDSSLIVLNEQLYFIATDQIQELAISKHHNYNYLLEPLAKNTAPAITLACMALNPQDIVLVTPSDHLINDEAEYAKCIQSAKLLANQGYLVTFGIVPDYPHTGYGYIHSKGEYVIGFYEKPNQQTAVKYLKQNQSSTPQYLWNSGMFCFKVETFLQEMQTHAPHIYEKCKIAFENRKKTETQCIRIDTSDMENIPENSIDYAVMEHSTKVKMIQSNIGWCDLGSFESLYENLPKDNDGNTICDQHISIGSQNNYIHSDQRVIATIDVEDLIIVDSGDALLVAKQGSGQKVKQIVEKVKQNTQLHNIHLQVHRPWGSYTVLEDTPGYKIKRIKVKPGHRLSLQKHFHRNEHWIVVSGTAQVQVAHNTYLVRPNESTYIKMGEVHRLSNPGKVPVVLIEAQIGDYLEEDDIVRIEDDFYRESGE